jgi:ABC-type uncharacterized transport system substrate-binding protein
MARYLLLPLLLLVFSTKAAAHPHVFIVNHVTVVFNEKGLSGFELKWMFDDITSAGFILDYDTNRDGRFSPQEASVLKQEAFDNLRNYDYMTEITIDGKPFTVQYVRDFRPEIVDGLLAYHFTIPCHVTAIATPKRITIAVYDQEYFIDFSLVRDAVRILTPQSVTVRHQLATNRNKTFYFAQMHPDELILEFQKN